MPYTPGGQGFKATDTSHIAAVAAGREAAHVRNAVYRFLFTAAAPQSAEQIAAALDYEPRQIKPRLTELRGDELIRDSGQRGVTSLNRSCILWVVIPPAERTP